MKGDLPMDDRDRLCQEAQRARRPRILSPHRGVGQSRVCAIAGMTASCSPQAAMLSDGSLGLPCGVCRELLMQLGCGDARILTGRGTGASVSLRELLPAWWA